MNGGVKEPGGRMLFSSAVFEKSISCIDFLSFDPGLVNAGIVHVRVDTQKKRFCVLHTALLDVLQPAECFVRKKEKKSKARLPTRVQPFCSNWPISATDFQYDESIFHKQRLEAALICEKSEVLFADRVALLPLALQSVSWLCGDQGRIIGHDIDIVLIEVQDPQNPQMRSVAHAIQSFYETKNAMQSDSSQRKMKVQFVSSRLKLSSAVLTVLANELKFEAPSSVCSNSHMERKNLVSLVDATSQPTRKRSAVQIFNALASQAPENHQFFNWYAAQRVTKHNIIDALLQCLSYCLENSIGFEPGILNGARKQLQSVKAKERREAKKAQLALALSSTSSAATTRVLPLDLTAKEEIEISGSDVAALLLPATEIPQPAVKCRKIAELEKSCSDTTALVAETGIQEKVQPALKRRKIVAIKF